jgi:hypothetical protein
MNKRLFLTLVSTIGFATSSLLAETPNSYQVTGPILELTDTKIVVQKGKEKWELARGADTKVTGELKVGAKVTIEYSMTAKTIEVKADKAKPAEAKPEKAK